jgi:hypothetical protein
MGILGGGSKSKSEAEVQNSWESLTAEVKDQATLLEDSQGAALAKDDGMATSFGKKSTRNIQLLGSNNATLSGNKVGGDIFMTDQGSISGAFDFATKALDVVTGSVSDAYGYIDNALGQFSEAKNDQETVEQLGFNPKPIFILGAIGIAGFTAYKLMKG